ncbi:membrane protein [Beggiatoa sp. PS]|nr:membrane protein [Beggiatoa sp. PS]
MTLALFGLLWLSSFPIVWYFSVFDGQLELRDAEIILFMVKVVGLLFANGMLYFILSRAIFEIIEETEALYVISAEYKNTTVADYLKEKLTWLLLSASGTIFYYLFSFTLFIDLSFGYLNDITKSQSGIIYQLFVELVMRGWTIEEYVLAQDEYVAHLNTLASC